MRWYAHIKPYPEAIALSGLKRRQKHRQINLLSVQVTILEQGTAAEEVLRGQAMAALLEQLAARGTLSDMADPVKWQRELRQDRPLPGRER